VVAWAPFAIEPSRAIIPFIAGSRTVPANGGSQLDCALSGEREFSSLTVHDLLVGSQSAAMFRHTFAVVDRSADMDQALAAMNAIPGCQDVFVTTDGTANGAVVGWLTNTMYMS